MAAPPVLAGVFGILFVFVLVAVIVASFVLVVMLPIALYMDARAVARADLE